MSLSQELISNLNANIIQNNSQSPSSVDSQNGYCTPKQYRNKKLDALNNEEPRSPLLKIPASPAMQRLGYGTGVGVYLMERSPVASGEMRSPWAVKKISKIREQNNVYRMRLEREAEILRKLSHPNIIGYRSFGKPSPETAYLAMERASKSLGDLIEERVDEQSLMDLSPFPAKYIEKVGADVAKALIYLHEEAKLIHGDLKSANVLIFGDFETAKLCDFGVSRKIGENGLIEGRYVGTEIWNPMEVILLNRGEKKYPVTSKSDIYPYGLTLHEMISLKPPHFTTAEDDCIDTKSNTNEFGTEDYDEATFDAALTRQLGKRPTLPDVDFDESYNLILGVFYCCTEEDPASRPSAKSILEMLEGASKTP